MCAKTTACIIARTVSKRLPLKAFRLMDKETTMLDYIIQRVKKCKRVDEIYVCTSAEAVDDIMEDYAWKNGVKCYRGSADEVIERMISVGTKTKSDFVIRITGDNVFTSYEYIDQQIQLAVDKNLDYVRVGSVPIGATAEIMSFPALQKCFNEMDPTVSEYLMLFMFNPGAYRCGVIKPFKEDYSGLSLTVDYPNDLVRTMEIFKHVDKEDFLDLKLHQIIDIIEKYKIPHAHLEQSGTVKLPYGKEVTYSDFAVDMNDRVQRSFKFSSKVERPYLYTETAFHHEGNLEYMLALIDASAGAGADGIKFQVVIELDQLLSTMNPAFTSLKRYVFTRDQWITIFKHSISKGLDLVVMPLDLKSLEVAGGFSSSIRFLELHSVSYYDKELVAAMCKSGMNCMLGAGGRTLDELRQSRDYFGSALSTFMVGFQSFPSRIQDVKLDRIAEIRRLFPDMKVGYADHSGFDDPWAVRSNDIAYALGATIFEKHITLDEGKKRVDFESAVGADKIRAIRQNLDSLYEAVSSGSNPFEMAEAEVRYRNRQKVVVAKHDLKKGDRLGPDNLRLKMTGVAGGIPEISVVSGKVLKANVDEDHVINKEDVVG